MQGRKTAVPTHDGQSMAAEYFAKPDMRGPAIVMIPAIFGVHDDVREMAWEYAAAGFPVLAPDVFHRTIPGPLRRDGAEKDQAIQRYETFDADQGARDVADACAFLRKQPECSGKVAVFGYCFGGRYAYLAAAQGAADGAVSFHGTKIGQSLDVAKGVTCPLQLHVGDSDPQIPLEEVERTRAALADKPSIGIFIYPGAVHGFTGRGRPSYHELADRMSQAGAFALMNSLRA